MTKLSTVIASVFISSAINAVCGYPGSPHFHRVVRSPHYGSFDFHPHPLPYPLFQTNNWSGIAKSSDGSAQGVFSGAAATATNSGPAIGQAVSLASADCDDENSAQSSGSAGKSEVQKINGDVSGGFGGHFSAHKEAHYSFQSGGGKFGAQGSGFDSQDNLESHGKSGSASVTAGQNSGDGQIQFGEFKSSDQGNDQSHSSAAINSNGQRYLLSQGKNERQQGVELISEDLHRGNTQGQNQEQGSFVTSSQSGVGGGFGQQKESTAGFGHQNGQQSIGFSYYTDVGFGQNKENNDQQNSGSTQHGDGFGQLKEQSNNGISHQGYGHERSGGYGVQGSSFGKLSGGFGQQSDFGFNQQRAQSDGFGHKNSGYHQQVQQGGLGQLNQKTDGIEQQRQVTGGFGGIGSNSQSSSFAHGRGFGFGGGYTGYDHSGYGRNFDHGYGFEHGLGGGNGFDRSKLQANSDAEIKQQQQQSGSELASDTTGGTGATQSTSTKDQSSAIGGALNLASQGLDAAQKARCTTCDQNGGYAFSNANSHSGSAIAVSIGG